MCNLLWIYKTIEPINVAPPGEYAGNLCLVIFMCRCMAHYVKILCHPQNRKCITTASSLQHHYSKTGLVFPTAKLCADATVTTGHTDRQSSDWRFMLFTMDANSITTTTTTTTTVLRPLWRILLVQNFTARTLLLTTTSAFGLGEDTGVVLNNIIYTVSVPSMQTAQ